MKSRDLVTIGAFIDGEDGGGGGTTNYNALSNKPRINDVELSGNKSAEELGLGGEVFVAVYERTSYADVKAAIDASRVIVLDMPANNNQFCITLATYTNGGDALMYAIYKMSDRATLMTVTLTPQNRWTVSHTDLQDKLISGTNIKTINGTSLLGSGNIDIQGSEYTAGNGIKIENGTISGTGVNVSKGETNVIEVEGFNASKVGFEFGEDVVLSASSPMLFGESVALQKKLVPGTNIKTVNNESLLGSGNLDVGGVDFEVDVETPYGTYKADGVTYPVYSKIVYIPALPSTAGSTSYPHGITGIRQVLAMYGVCTNGLVMNSPRQNGQDNIALYQVQKSGNIVIEVGKDRSSMGAYVTLIYAKNA